MKYWLLIAVAFCALSIPAYAQREPGFPQPSYDMIEPGTLATAKLPQFKDVTFKQHLNQQMPLGAAFKDEYGNDVTLSKYFDGERPVVLAGGTLISDEALLERMQQARDEGAVGCSVGRNVFQHRRPQAITQAISRVFRDRWPATHALQELLQALDPELVAA